MTEQNRRRFLHRDAIRALTWIILTAVIGIILLSLWGAALRFGVIGTGDAGEQSIADEALSILGNIAAASVGGLVGWLTRDMVIHQETKDTTKEE